MPDLAKTVLGQAFESTEWILNFLEIAKEKLLKCLNLHDIDAIERGILLGIKTYQTFEIIIFQNVAIHKIWANIDMLIRVFAASWRLSISIFQINMVFRIVKLILLSWENW